MEARTTDKRSLLLSYFCIFYKVHIHVTFSLCSNFSTIQAGKIVFYQLISSSRNIYFTSPAYGDDAVRINILYFQKSNVIPADYFQQFWDLLNKNNIPFRPHWGKALPATLDLTASYPKWPNWKALRDQMDPHQIFLTGYWRGRLGLT
jgi:hypothetical protein